MVTQNAAQQEYRNDPSVRSQADVWSRTPQGSDKSGFGSTNPPVSSGGWNSVDPLWNSRPLQQPSTSGRASQAPVDRDSGWDDRAQTWDNSEGNNVKPNDRTVGGSDGQLGWNTWNADQNTWSQSQQGSTGTGQGWTSSVQLSR